LVSRGEPRFSMWVGVPKAFDNGATEGRVRERPPAEPNPCNGQ